MGKANDYYARVNFTPCPVVSCASVVVTGTYSSTKFYTGILKVMVKILRLADSGGLSVIRDVAFSVLVVATDRFIGLSIIYSAGI